jgi:hypothetical protein
MSTNNENTIISNIFNYHIRKKPDIEFACVNSGLYSS